MSKENLCLLFKLYLTDLSGFIAKCSTEKYVIINNSESKRGQK